MPDTAPVVPALPSEILQSKLPFEIALGPYTLRTVDATVEQAAVLILRILRGSGTFPFTVSDLLEQSQTKPRAGA